MLRIRAKSAGIRDKVLLAILIVAILGALGMLGYIITNPRAGGEKFTEFYILGLSGKAGDYPKELMVGHEGQVVVGIINHEYEQLTYRVEATVEGVNNSEVGPVTLEDGEKWEGIVRFAPNRVGDDQKVEFLLYRLDQNQVYGSLYLWIDVKKQMIETK